LISYFAQGQNVSSYAVKPQNFNGSLAKYLDVLTEQTGVLFSYKNRLIKKKNIKITKTCISLDCALLQIKKQCSIDYNKVGAKSITLYPAKGTYVIGTVVDKNSTERVVEASLQIEGSDNYSATDKEGNFRLYCLSDSVNIIVYHSDYQLLRATLPVSKNAQFFIKLEPISTLQEVAVINADSVDMNTTSFDEVKPSQRQALTIGGEADAMAHVKLLSGVQNVSFGQQGLAIRGGSPDQNFTLLDGIPVYNTYHLLGLYSIFNSSSINSIKLYKEAFPSKYTNRLSSVIDVNLKNGNKKKTEVQVDVGVLSSGIYLNGPIVKNKLSYTISARRTYADLLTLPLQQLLSPNSTSRLWSYDFLGKLHWQLNERNDISISGYNGGDQLDFRTKRLFESENINEEKTKGSLGWRNEVLGAKWNSQLSGRVELHSEVSFSGYRLRFSDQYELLQDTSYIFNSSAYSNGLQEIRGGLDADIQWNKSNILTVGVGAVEYNFLPFERGYTSISDIRSTDTSLVSRELFSREFFGFMENKTYFRGGNISYGFRLSRFSAGQKSYVRFQPKINLIQNLNNREQLRFSMTTSSQFVHLVPNNNLGLPVDIWLPVTDSLKPMGMTQFSTKYVIKKNNWELESGIFTKFFSNILEQESGTQLLSQENWQDNLEVGSGRSYGLELAGKLQQRQWSAYGSYTYSRTKRSVAQINQGMEYFSKFDRPHIVNLLAEYKHTNQLIIVATWSYASGNPITVPISRYVTMVGGEQIIVEEYGDINNFRLPSTHHLDIACVIDKEHKRFNSSFTFGVYNVYNRLNPFMAFIGLDDNAEPQLKLRSYLPVLPTFKYSIDI